jgi:hypothetical protein
MQRIYSGGGEPLSPVARTRRQKITAFRFVSCLLFFFYANSSFDDTRTHTHAHTAVVAAQRSSRTAVVGGDTDRIVIECVVVECRDVSARLVGECALNRHCLFVCFMTFCFRRRFSSEACRERCADIAGMYLLRILNRLKEMSSHYTGIVSSARCLWRCLTHASAFKPSEHAFSMLAR